MRILGRIFKGSLEHDVFARTKIIIDHAASANKLLVETINGENNIDTIHEIERLADKEVFEITSSITSGAIAPNLIDDMMQFVNMQDDIVDTIFNLSRTIVRFRKTKKEMDSFTKSKLLDLSELTNSALVLLYEMHKVNTLAEAQRLRSKIKLVEQKGDELKDALLEYAYSAKLDFKSFYYVQDVAYLSDDVLDRCEDTSDMIASIMRSIIT